MKQRKFKLSKISAMHFIKLLLRFVLFLGATVLYVITRTKEKDGILGEHEKMQLFLILIWIIYTLEMALRFFPSKLESIGCQKQFARNYKSTGETVPQLQSWKRTFAVAVAWLLLNSIIGVLYYIDIIDKGILILTSLAYGVCDMICILFFCPFQTWLFQTWFMKNRCCTDCRIYNWDFAMMFTPYIFIPHVYTWSLLAMSLVLLLRWEITLHKYPRRFSEKTNKCLSCANCEEKLCYHKKQLRNFLKTKTLDSNYYEK